MKINGSNISAFMFNGKKATKTIFNGKTVWSSGDTPTPPPDPPQPTTTGYIRFHSSGSAKLGVTWIGSAPNIYLEASTDGVTWSELNTNNRDARTDFGNGTDLYVRGKNTKLGSADYATNYFIVEGSNVEVSGDILALLDYEEYPTSIPEGAFARLFNNCAGVVSVPDLPNLSSVGNNAYAYMFYNTGISQIVSRSTLDITTSAISYKILASSHGSGILYKPSNASYSGQSLPSTWEIRDL